MCADWARIFPPEHPHGIEDGCGKVAKRTIRKSEYVGVTSEKPCSTSNFTCIFDLLDNRNRNSSIFSNLLRPECVLFLWDAGLHKLFTLQFRFVKKYKKALSSDALSSFARPGDKTNELNRDVLEATRHLFSNIIPSFATKLCENVVTDNAKYLHSQIAPYTPFG